MKSEMGPFDPAIFRCISCHPPSLNLWESPFLPIEECSPDTVKSVCKAPANKDVMLCTRMAPDLKDPFRSFV